jgi:hypothetical protein
VIVYDSGLPDDLPRSGLDLDQAVSDSLDAGDVRLGDSSLRTADRDLFYPAVRRSVSDLNKLFRSRQNQLLKLE